MATCVPMIIVTLQLSKPSTLLLLMTAARTVYSPYTDVIS